MTDPLTAAIARTAGAIRLMAPAETWPWRFARCWMLANRVEHHDGTDAEIDAALADFHLLPIDVPGRPKLAAFLVMVQFSRGMLNDFARIRHAVALADIANADTTTLPGWSKADAALRAHYLTHRFLRGRTDLTPADALVQIERLAATVGDEEPYATTVELARVNALQLQAIATNDHAAIEQAAIGAERLRQRHHNDPLLGANAEVIADMMRVMQSLQRGDPAAVRAGAARMAALAERFPAGHPLHASVANLATVIRTGVGMLDAGVAVGVQAGVRPELWGTPTVPAPALPDDALEFLRSQAARPGAVPGERAAHFAALGFGHLLGGGAGSLDDAVRATRTAVATGPPDDPNRPVLLGALGYCLGDRYEQRGDPVDLAEAISAFEQARSLAASPAHPQWSMLSMALAHTSRMAGRTREGLSVALDGLRGHAWTVLLQADLAGRTNAARDAAQDAIDVARWCLADNEPAAAAIALDAGRGLMLYAAIEHRAVADRLTALGATALAERWRTAVGTSNDGQLPMALRQAVLAALTGTATAATRLLDPPDGSEVRQALTMLGIDALVYLVPGDDGVGAAVIVPATGDPTQVLLPELRKGTMPVLDHTRASGRYRDGWRDAGVVTDGAASDVQAWAWSAAVEPVLKRIPEPPGRLRRIALIPMRELATVAWHAARRDGEGGATYAVERAVFSYALSARLLCEVAARPPVPLDGGGLFVADPDTGGHQPDLVAARAEAWTIRQCHYPGAAYVGRQPDGSTGPAGPGRPDEILAWLRDPAGGSVLHLACHGVASPVFGPDNPEVGGATSDTAQLVLHEGEPLTAERIVAAMTGTAGRPVGLVALAACHSGTAARGGYDEAFSLAATFQISGARTVVCSPWTVPDDATSLLMFMFHHYLRDGLAPAHALHRAQLWMLSPDRVPPVGMPADLRARLGYHDASDVTAWATFIHIGQ